MVLPGDELKVDIRHTGMRDGNTVVKVETWNTRGEKVLQGSAEVSQLPTIYVFTGYGSQEAGMDMDLYNSSPAARAVWEGAGAHLLAVYGFSIVEIVKDNQKAKTIHFGGIKGQAIRQRFMNMAYDAMDKDGNIKLPLFADIDVRTQQYTFSHPAGLLFATQFAQIALVVAEKVAFEDMRVKPSFRAERLCICGPFFGRILRPCFYTRCVPHLHPRRRQLLSWNNYAVCSGT
jgi:fatty acid synthase subunit alpha, fungi type